MIFNQASVDNEKGRLSKLENYGVRQTELGIWIVNDALDVVVQARRHPDAAHGASALSAGDQVLFIERTMGPPFEETEGKLLELDRIIGCSEYMGGDRGVKWKTSNSFCAESGFAARELDFVQLFSPIRALFGDLGRKEVEFFQLKRHKPLSGGETTG